MALTPERKAELLEQFKQELEEATKLVIEDSNEAVPKAMRDEAEESRDEGKHPLYTGLNHTGYTNVADAGDDATIRGYQSNSYLTGHLSKQLQVLTNKASYHFKQGVTQKKIVIGCNVLREQLEEKQEKAKTPAQKEELRYLQQIAQHTYMEAGMKVGGHNFWLSRSEEVAHFLTGEVPAERLQEGIADFAMEELGIDITSEEIAKEKLILGTPSIVEFSCENTYAVNTKDFAKKLTANANNLFNPRSITQDEMEYGIATFDRAMVGMYGSSGKDLKPDDPMFLGKFDHIFFNGKSVNSLCEAALEFTTDPNVRSNYMKAFTTAMAIARDSRMECAVPDVTLVERNGRIERQFAPMSKESPRIIPAVSKVQEKPPNWFKRAAARIGLYKIGHLQKEYEQMLGNDENRAERHAEMAKSVDNVFSKALRDEAQLAAFEADRLKLSEHNRASSFFDLVQLGEINEFCDDEDGFFRPEEISGLKSLDIPARQRSMAMLYMYSKGIPLEDIMSEEPELREAKLESGREFYRILHEGTHEEIAKCYVDMAQSLINTRVPDIDYTNDIDLVGNYSLITFLQSGYKNLTQSMGGTPIEAVFDEKMGPEDNRALERIDTYTAALVSCVKNRLDYIKDSPMYSQAAPSSMDEPSRYLVTNAVASEEPLRQMNRLFADVRGATFKDVEIDPKIRETFQLYSGVISSSLNNSVARDLAADGRTAAVYSLLNRTGAENPYRAIEQAADAASGLTKLSPAKRIDMPEVERTVTAEASVPEARDSDAVKLGSSDLIDAADAAPVAAVIEADKAGRVAVNLEDIDDSIRISSPKPVESGAVMEQSGLEKR